MCLRRWYIHPIRERWWVCDVHRGRYCFVAFAQVRFYQISFEAAISHLIHYPEYNSTLILRSQVIREDASHFPSESSRFRSFKRLATSTGDSCLEDVNGMPLLTNFALYTHPTATLPFVILPPSRIQIDTFSQTLHSRKS